MSMGRVYGIDLGTTYSCIAHVDEQGKATVLPNAEGDLTTPSVVLFETADNVVVGQAAKEVLAIFPDQCVSTIKRAMGDPNWERTFFGQSYKPQDISSFILRKVVGDAAELMGETIEDVVITCPAYFGVNEKEATRQAGVLAGLNVLYVIPEPTAAALSYGIERDQNQVVLVFDLGGGTLDVTVIAIEDGDITVICTGGDHQLGGKDWDDAIVSYFVQRFEEQTGIPADELLDDQETYQELLIAAERCKKTLSSRHSVVEAVRFRGERIKAELTRETFDRITVPYLERCLSLTEQEISKAKSRGHIRIDQILLVGGSTFMPQVAESIRKHFPFRIRRFDPNQAVAKGAALFGYKCYLDEQIKIRVAVQTGQAPATVEVAKVDNWLVEEVQGEILREHGLSLPGLKAVVEKKVTNVTSKSFGLVVINVLSREVVINLIEIDDPVPRSTSRTFATYEDGQIQVDLRCVENRLQGRSEIELTDCHEIGSVVLEFGRPLAKGSPVEITFNLGPDGMLSLKGRDVTTGRQMNARFKTESIMSREQIEASKSRNLALRVD